MLLLITGLVIWIAAHLFRSFFPSIRESFHQKLGNGYKAAIGVVILTALFMMVIGYRSAETVSLWSTPGWALYVNNVLMFLALYIYFTSATQVGTAFVFGSLKHPQLVGFKVWALTHILVNGELKALILFGGLIVWAVLQSVVSNRSVSLVDRDEAKINSPWVHLGLVVGMFGLIVFVHTLSGRWPLAI